MHPSLSESGPPPSGMPARPQPAELVIPKKYIFTFVAVVLLVALVYSGLLNRGYESQTIHFRGFTRTSHGSSWGPKRFLLRAGQTFTIDYETDIRKGGLYIRLYEFYTPPNTPSTGEVRVRQTGTGRLEIPIRKTGVYRLWFRGLPDADGYDLSYTVWWKTE